MLTDEQLIEDLRTALERESAEMVPPPGLLASIHDELRSSPAPKRRRRPGWSRGPKPRLAHLAPAAALLVVVAVVAVFLGVQSRKPGAPTATHGGFTLVYRGEPTAQAPVVNGASVARAVSVMRARIAELAPGGAASVTVTSAGTEIFVHVGAGTQHAKRLEQLIGTTARLEFYDWEANALAPNGKSVASLLSTQDPQALEISQGGSTAAPGAPGAGSMPLYQAVRLASKQPYEASGDNARFGSEYFAFGAPGSAACAAAAAYYHVFLLDPHSHCYLAGPQDNTSDLNSALPPRVSAPQAQVLTVKRGTVVLEAAPASFSHPPQWYSPSAQFFVLRDHVSLFGNEITHARESTDASGAPDVTFGFPPKGQRTFQDVTAKIAHRGSTVSGFGQTLDQHFAVALDTQLITVPSIDFKVYPDGVTGATGADITGGFTIQSARDLATQLRLGALPINLKLLAVTPER